MKRIYIHGHVLRKRIARTSIYLDRVVVMSNASVWEEYADAVIKALENIYAERNGVLHTVTVRVPYETDATLYASYDGIVWRWVMRGTFEGEDATLNGCTKL